MTTSTDAAGPKKMPVADFVAGGYLQEVNRRLLHPLGLALEVTVAADPVHRLLLPESAMVALKAIVEKAHGIDDDVRAWFADAFDEAEHDDRWLSGIWDCRDDPAGIVFAPEALDPAKAYAVSTELEAREAGRRAETGYEIQPVR